MKVPFLFCVAGVFIGTFFYTMAAYYHLKLGPKWNFLSALMIAVPFLLLEYTFSLHANHYLHKDYNFTPSQILSMTICFNFITIWLFNYFVMENGNVHFLREIAALFLILLALFITNVVK